MTWRRWVGVAAPLVAAAMLVYGVTVDHTQTLHPLVDLLGLIALTSPALVGAYLVWRLPENSVGWILTWFGLTFTLGMLAESSVALTGPFASWGAWLGAWQWALSLAMVLVLLPLRFPDGRLPSPRFRWVTPVVFVGFALVLFGNAFRASVTLPVDGESVVVDLPLPLQLPTMAFDAAAALGIAVMATSVGGAVAAAIVRFRASAGIERQQMKVFAMSLAFSVTGMALNVVLYQLGAVSWANAVFALLVLVLVVSFAIAILRYRLYEFDRLVSRTVSYALVAGGLAVVYGFGAVWLPSRLVGEQTPLFVAGSTLAAAALFNPLRRTVMRWVDRRFNRSRYDPEEIADDFGRRVRDQVDTDVLADDWATVVTKTLQPAAVGVWIRDHEEHGEE